MAKQKRKLRLGTPDLSSLMSLVNLQPATNIILNAYHAAGYSGGGFENAHFEVSTASGNAAIVFKQPEYTRFMLYGRGPGKMPPISAIESWTKKRGITISPWAIARHIGKYGTKGNDFMTPVLPSVNKYIDEQITLLLAKQITEK